MISIVFIKRPSIEFLISFRVERKEWSRVNTKERVCLYIRRLYSLKQDCFKTCCNLCHPLYFRTMVETAWAPKVINIQFCSAKYPVLPNGIIFFNPTIRGNKIFASVVSFMNNTKSLCNSLQILFLLSSFPFDSKSDYVKQTIIIKILLK